VAFSVKIDKQKMTNGKNFVLKTFKSMDGLGDLITQRFDSEEYVDTNFSKQFNDILIRFFNKLDSNPDLVRQKLNRPKE